MIDWIKELKDYEKTPQYDKSLNIVVYLNRIKNALHFTIDGRLKEALGLDDFTFKSILAGDNNIPITEYDRVLNYLTKFIMNVNNVQQEKEHHRYVKFISK